MPKKSEQQTKKTFSPNLGFIGTGAIAGALFFNSGNIYLVAGGLALPFLGGKTMDEKASLAVGEILGLFAPKALPHMPGLVLPFIQNHPFISAGLAAVGACYYYQEEIYESTIGKIQDYFSKTEIE